MSLPVLCLFRCSFSASALSLPVLFFYQCSVSLGALFLPVLCLFRYSFSASALSLPVLCLCQCSFSSAARSQVRRVLKRDKPAVLLLLALACYNSGAACCPPHLLCCKLAAPALWDDIWPPWLCHTGVVRHCGEGPCVLSTEGAMGAAKGVGGSARRDQSLSQPCLWAKGLPCACACVPLALALACPLRLRLRAPCACVPLRLRALALALALALAFPSAVGGIRHSPRRPRCTRPPLLFPRRPISTSAPSTAHAWMTPRSAAIGW